MNSAEQLDPRVASAFYGAFPSLRPLQAAAIEPILTGHNVILSSSTGSGKTEAVMAPLVSRYLRTIQNNASLTILYVAPTKALVNDLERRLYPPLQNSLGIHVGIRHGDRDDLKAGGQVHVLLTTPESLDVLLFRREAALDTVQALVIDEVHLLYNTQRGLQLSALLQRLMQRLGRKVQWAALSATIGRLEDVRAFIVGSTQEAICLHQPTARPIDAHVQHVPHEAAFLKLVQKLTAARPVKLLVFANARRECERLAGILHRDPHLRPAVFTHYSSLSPDVRRETEQKFAAGRTAICIATSTLELGIDIGDIDAVILWDVPASVESFLQRIGRGNRRSNKANVICLVPDTATHPTGDALRFLALLDAAQKGELPIRKPYELFGAVAQQCLSIIASDKGRFTRIADLAKIFEHHAHLERPVVEAVLAGLADRGYLQRHGFQNKYGANDALYELVDYRLIYGNFSASSQTIEVNHGAKVLGEIPVINLFKVRPRSIIRFAGRRWQVAQVTLERIAVEPTTLSGAAIDIIYPGAGLGFDAFLTDRIWDIIHRDDHLVNYVAPSWRSAVATARHRVREVCTLSQIPFTRSIDGIRYFTFGGYLVNKAVALITRQSDYEIDDISLRTAVPVAWNTIPTAPQAYSAVYSNLFEATSEQSLYQTLLPADLQQLEFLEEWMKDETTAKVLQRLAESEPVQVGLGILPF